MICSKNAGKQLGVELGRAGCLRICGRLIGRRTTAARKDPGRSRRAAREPVPAGVYVRDGHPETVSGAIEGKLWRIETTLTIIA
jgi:hypothetical protein